MSEQIKLTVQEYKNLLAKENASLSIFQIVTLLDIIGGWLKEEPINLETAIWGIARLRKILNSKIINKDETPVTIKKEPIRG